MMHRARVTWGHRARRAGLVVCGFVAAGCNAGRERAVRDSVALAIDGGETTPRRLASDATLTLFNTPRLAAAFRAVADSFAVREAVSVRPESVDSVSVAHAMGELGKTPDVIALAADAFPRALMPAHTRWYVRFATDRIVLAYRDSSRGAAALDSTNWWSVLQRRGVRTGRVDPSAGPAGYRALLVMRLAEAYYEQPKLAAKLAASSSRNVRPDEAGLVAALDSTALDYIWTYESTARAEALRYLRLPHEIDLGEPADSARYAAAEVAVPLGQPRDTLRRTAADTARETERDTVGGASGDTLRIRGAPIVYGISIPNDAPSPRHAERFVRFLFSAEGRRTLEAAHLDVLAQPVAVGSDVPPTILASLGGAAAPTTPNTGAPRADTAGRGPTAPTGRAPDTAAPQQRRRP